MNIMIIKINIIIFICVGVSLLLYLFSGLVDLALRNKYYKDSFFGKCFMAYGKHK